MPPNVILKRPDGTSFAATPEQAERLQVLGYRRESDEEETARIQGASQKAYYERQKAETFAEGSMSGASLGFTDYLMDEHGRRRAEYNPGTRLAGEITGMVGASLIPGVLPASMAVRGGRAAGSLVERGVARGAITGATEGAAFGLGSEISKSAINEEPLTIEGAVHGIGWGALLGGGLGALGSKMSSYVSKADDVVTPVASSADEAAERLNYAARHDYHTALQNYGKTVKAADDIVAVTKGEWGVVRGEVSNLRKTINQVTKAADDEMEAIAEKARAHVATWVSLLAPGLTHGRPGRQPRPLMTKLSRRLSKAALPSWTKH